MVQIPTLKQIYNGIIADLETELNVNISTTGKSFLRALAAVEAAKLWLNYVYLAKVQKNIFVDTADPEAEGGTLERFGRVKIGRDPFEATAGQYILQVTGTIGQTIPAATTLKSNDDSSNPRKLYILDSAYTTVSNPDFITVRALSAGNAGKLQILDNLTFTAPIALINNIAEVSSEAIAPINAETIEEYRSVVLQSFQLEPQGGAAVDYRLWASDAQGVNQTYPYRSLTEVAELDIYIEAKLIDSVDGKGTPTATILTAVEDVIELDPDITLPINLRGRRPLGVFVANVLPIIIKNVDITINNQSFTLSEQTVVTDAIRDYLSTVRPYIVGADIEANRNDTTSENRIGTVVTNTYPSKIFDSVSLEVAGVPVPNYNFDRGEIPYLNSVTYA